jgi:hypothetical protein
MYWRLGRHIEQRWRWSSCRLCPGSGVPKDDEPERQGMRKVPIEIEIENDGVGFRMKE